MPVARFEFDGASTTVRREDRQDASSSSSPSKAAAPDDHKKPAGDKTAVAPDAGAPAADPADPSQTQKINPNEVFRDPKAEALADLAKLQVGGRPGP